MCIWKPGNWEGCECLSVSKYSWSLLYVNGKTHSDIPALPSLKTVWFLHLSASPVFVFSCNNVRLGTLFLTAARWEELVQYQVMKNPKETFGNGSFREKLLLLQYCLSLTEPKGRPWKLAGKGVKQVKGWRLLNSPLLNPLNEITYMESYCILICVGWGLSPCPTRWGEGCSPHPLVPWHLHRIGERAEPAPATNWVLWFAGTLSQFPSHTTPAGAGESVRGAQEGGTWQQWASKHSLLIEPYQRIDLQQLTLKYKRYRPRDITSTSHGQGCLWHVGQHVNKSHKSQWPREKDISQIFLVSFLEQHCSFTALLHLGAIQSLLSWWMRILSSFCFLGKKPLFMERVHEK